MTDLINREDAIKAVDEAFDLGDCYCDRYGIRGAIQCIPSAEKQGEWIYVTVEEWMRTGRDYGHHCSECDEINESGKSNFCPNCGAKMKGENDETI